MSKKINEVKQTRSRRVMKKLVQQGWVLQGTEAAWVIGATPTYTLVRPNPKATPEALAATEAKKAAAKEANREAAAQVGHAVGMAAKKASARLDASAERMAANAEAAKGDLAAYIEATGGPGALAAEAARLGSGKAFKAAYPPPPGGFGPVRLEWERAHTVALKTERAAAKAERAAAKEARREK